MSSGTATVDVTLSDDEATSGIGSRAAMLLLSFEF